MVARDTEAARALAEQLTGLYADAQRRLAVEIARRLREGIESPTWQADKLAALGDLRRWTQGLTRRLTQFGSDAAAAAVREAYAAGGLSALRALQGSATQAVRDRVERALPNLPAQQRLAGALSLKLRGTHLPMTRWAEDAYQKVIAAGAAPDVILGTHTRLQASQRAWNDLLGQGVTGFTDTAGRRWNLAGYTEMATRTTVAQSMVEGQLDRMGEAGLDLVIVSDAVQECQRCRPWEGKILSTGGHPGKRQIQRQSEASADLVDVNVAGTLSEAIAAGLMHPQCRHSVSPYIVGVTRPITRTADPQGDAARQKLRQLERDQRADRLREAAPIDPAALPAIKARIKSRAETIKAHVAENEHLGLTRKPSRERIDLGYKRTGNAPPTSAPTLRPTPAPRPTPAFDVEPAGVGPLPNRDVRPIGDLMNIDRGLSAGQRRVADDLLNSTLSRAIDGTYGGLDARVSSSIRLGRQIGVSGRIFQDGHLIGSFQRTFTRKANGQLIVEHDLLAIERKYQGTGFANQFNRNLFDWYRRSGVHHVEVHANIDVGGYTWARQGFDFRSNAEVRRYFRSLRTKLARLTGGGRAALLERFPGMTYDQVYEQLTLAQDYLATGLEGGRVSAYDLSQLGRRPGMGRNDMWIGKELMLGSDWYGTLIL